MKYIYDGLRAAFTEADNVEVDTVGPNGEGDSVKTNFDGFVVIELTEDEVTLLLETLDDIIEEHQSVFNSDIYQLRDQIRSEAEGERVGRCVKRQVARYDAKSLGGVLPDSLEIPRGILAPGRRRAFVLAGNATLTIRSVKTGARFTYRVRKSNRGDAWFVKLMNGPDNENNYIYIGTIFDKRRADDSHVEFCMTKNSKVGDDAPSFRAFAWFTRHFESADIEVWHEGRCGRCGRKLTVPESIESGIGPVCEGI